jgi:hypothetical protein
VPAVLRLTKQSPRISIAMEGNSLENGNLIRSVRGRGFWDCDMMAREALHGKARQPLTAFCCVEFQPQLERRRVIEGPSHRRWSTNVSIRPWRTLGISRGLQRPMLDFSIPAQCPALANSSRHCYPSTGIRAGSSPKGHRRLRVKDVDASVASPGHYC